jgi:hypothetical protein
MKTKILLSAGLILAISCKARAFTSDSDAASQESFTNNVKAAHCEIFIDKAFMTEARPDNGLRQTLHLFVKINPEKLDGAVTQVVQYDERVNSSSHGTDRRPWSPTDLSPFAGSSDYFEIDLALIDNGSWYKQSFFYEASFYVQTDKGTRYWANANSNPDFETRQGNWVLSMNNLKGGALTELPIFTQNPDLRKIRKTRDNGGVGRFFNPQSCE